MYSAFVFAHDVPQALDIIADTIRNPNFTPQEVFFILFLFLFFI